MGDRSVALPAGVALESPAVEAVSPLRCRLGESPLWSVADRALWWVDIDGRTLNRFDPADAKAAAWPLDQRIGCIGLHADGGFVAALEAEIRHLRPAPGGRLESSVLATVRRPRPDMRFNDGRCDRAGRFWAATMVLDGALAAADGALYRLDAEGLSAPVVTGLVTGNGTAFSPSGDTLYLSDSHPTVQRIWRFDLRDDGTLANRRAFVDMRDYPGRPDGAAVDVDGGYWTCATDAGLLLRFTPEGRLDRALRLPVPKPTMCAFGGADLGDLYVASLQPSHPFDGYDPALDGALLRLRPGAQGIAEVPFRPSRGAAAVAARD